MNRQESGRKGGISTRAKNLMLCPCCGSPIKSQSFSEIGKKGGEATLRKYGRDFYRKCGRLGGRTNTKEKRLALLGAEPAGEL